jgi:hypothetical protein
MPKYFFHLHDESTVSDVDGTDLPNLVEARRHALLVSRELTFRSEGMLGRDWSHWEMSVCDNMGTEFFSLKLSQRLSNGSG